MSNCPSIGTRKVWDHTNGWTTLKEDRTLAQSWWNHLHVYEKHAVITLPNFNAALFKEITGVKVNIKDIEEEFSMYLEEKDKKKK